jgi:sterol desaturase/sphingolipid hydroxylase (fatty acid hydroxylase superfamily)
MELIAQLLRDICCAPENPLAFVYWLPTSGVAIAFWLSMGGGKGLREFLNWDGVLTHKSSRVDLLLFLIGRVMALLGLASYFTLAPAAARYVADISPLPPVFAEGLSPIGLALALFLLFDLGQYLSHRIYHASSLWPLHAVHHSAEVLTPLTTFRAHPLAMLISSAFNSVIIGVGLGLLVGMLSPDMAIAEIAGVNAVVVIANATMVNLHHSQMNVSFGPIIERILISPAQHQIHHSRDPRHFNRNFGNVLAVWDWMFGSIYLIRQKEVIHFGLDGDAEAPLMTQNLWPMIMDPIRRVFMPKS